MMLTRPGGALTQATAVAAMQGMEEIDMDDMTLPRLAICQNTSDERKPGHAKYIEGLNDGMVFNTLTQDIISDGQTAFFFIPLFAFKTRIKFNEPIGSGIDCSSANAKTGGRHNPQSCEQCGYSQFSEGEKGERERPECFLFYNYVVLLYLADEASPQGIKLEPIVLSFKSTGVKVAKKFNTMIRQTMRAAAFMSVYKATTVLEKFTEGSAYNFSISYAWENKGMLDPNVEDDKAILERAAGWFGSMRPDVARAATMKHAEEVAREAASV